MPPSRVGQTHQPQPHGIGLPFSIKGQHPLIGQSLHEPVKRRLRKGAIGQELGKPHGALKRRHLIQDLHRLANGSICMWCVIHF